MKNILKTLPVTIKNGRIALNFKLADVKAMTIVGVDLVALMQDGSRLLLPGLALKVLEKPSPQLQFEDQELVGTELFTKVDIDNVTLKDASEALGVPSSDPTSQDTGGATDQAQSVALGNGGPESTAGKEDKGAEEPPAWYQEYGWIFGLVGLAGLALGLSSRKKSSQDEQSPSNQPPANTVPDAPGGAPSDDATPAPGPSTIQVTGGLAAGVLNHAQTLSVMLYDGQGGQLGQGELTVGPDGQVVAYRATLPSDYVGFVRVVMSDQARDGLGFIDEYRQALALSQGMTPAQAEQFASSDFPTLNAIGYRAEGQSQLTISVTPLTELAVRLLAGVSADPTQPLDGAVTVEQVNEMMAAVARLATQFTQDDVQILDILGPVMAINANNFAAAADGAQVYGRVLASLTGLDAASGALENSLHLLTSGLAADADGALHLASTVEGAILLAAMQEANKLMGQLVDSSLFEAFKLPEAPWAAVTAVFTDASEAVSPTLDMIGKDKQPSVTVSWDPDSTHVAAGQTVALYLFDGQKVASHVLSQEEVDAASVVLRAQDYGDMTLGDDGVKRLFAALSDDDGGLVARSEPHTYGLVSVDVDRITNLSADTGVSPSDFITNQPVQAVSGTYLGVLGPNTRIEVSADGGNTWVATKATPAADGTGGTWVSDSLRLDGTPSEEAPKLQTRVTVSGVNGEQPLTLAGASHDFILDVTPPDAAVASIDSISAPFAGGSLPGVFLFTEASQTIRGTLRGTTTDDDRVMVSVDGGVNWILGEISADGATWSAEVGFSRHGVGDILARVNDVAGNATDSVAAPYQFSARELVGLPPTQAVQIVTVTDNVGDADSYDFAGALGPNMSTDDRRLTLSGSISEPLVGDQVLVVISTLEGAAAPKTLGIVNVAPDAQEWSFTPVGDMDLGLNHIEVKVFSPGANAYSPHYPEGVDETTPGAQSNWGSWDVNVQSISFEGVVIPGVTSVNLLEIPNRVTDNGRPILTGALAAPLLPDERVSLYDVANGREPRLVGTAEVTPRDDGAGATWRFAFRDDEQLGDGEHRLRAVIELSGPDGSRVPLLSAVTPTVVVSTELPDQAVTIDQVLDDVGVYMGMIASGASTDDTTPTLSGRLSAPLRPGQTMQVLVEDADHPERFFTYRPVVDESGLAWSLTVQPALPEGDYNLSAGVVNVGGAMGPGIAEFNLRINSLTFTNLEDSVGSIRGNVLAGAEPFVTDDRGPILRGSLGTTLGQDEVLRIVSRHGAELTVLGEATLTPTDDGRLAWQFSTDAAGDGQGLLPDGQSTLSAQIVDVASGQIRLAADRVIVVDDGVPTESANVSAVRDQFLGVNGFVGPLAANQSTDDRQPLISGTLVGVQSLLASRVVQVVDNLVRPDGTTSEGVLGVATVGADGRWSFQPGTNLAPGEHTFSAQVVNRANGESGPRGQAFTVRENGITFTVVQDAVGPLQGNVLDAAVFTQPPITDDLRPQLSGRLEMPLGPGERVAVYDSENGGPVSLLGTATVTGSSWVFNPGTELRNGVHGLQVRVERLVAGANAQVLFSASVPPITVDGTSTPVTQRVMTLAVTDNNGANGSRRGVVVDQRASMDDRTPVVSGTLSAALDASQQVQVFAALSGGAERRLGVATTTGANWTYTVGSQLPYGLNTISARVVAVNSGLVSNTLSTSVNVNNITLSGIIEHEGGFNVLVRDRHGTGDNTVTLRGSLGAPLLLASERVTVYAKAEGEPIATPLGVATLEQNGLDWSFALPTRGGVQQVWREGEYEVLVRIEDMSSRSALAVARTTFTVDTAAPEQTATITGYQDQVGDLQAVFAEDVSTDDARGILQGTIDAPINGATRGVVLYEQVDGQLIRLGQATVTGTAWTFQNPVAFASGAHSFLARVENLVADKVGGESPVFPIHVQQVYLDAIMASGGDETNILTADLNGTSITGELRITGHLGTSLAPGEQLWIAVDGVRQKRAAEFVGTAGEPQSAWGYTLENDEALAQGDHVIAAYVMDAAGNERRVASAPYSVHIDNEAPVETVTISRARDNRAAGPSFTGDNPSAVSSDDPLPQLRGSVSAALTGGRSVAIYGQMAGQDAPEFLGYATLAANATWTFQVDRELPFGDTVFTARVVNRAQPDTLRGPVSPEFIVAEQELSITSLVDQKGGVTGDLFQSQATTTILRTDDLRPTLKGHLAAPLKAGETIAIFHGGARLGEATIDTDGVSWSFSPQEDLAQRTGRFSAVLQATDGTSLISTLTPDVAVSVLRPGHAVTIGAVQVGSGAASVDVLSGGGVLDNALPRLSGTLAQALNADEVVRVYLQDSTGARHFLGNAAASGSTWALQLDVALPAGTSHLLAAVENRADSQDVVWSAPVDVNLVSLSPISVQGVTAQDHVTNERPRLSGVVTTDNLENLTVRVLVDGAAAGTVAIDQDGQWNFELSDDLDSGLHQVGYALLRNGQRIAAVPASESVSFTVGAVDGQFSLTLDQAEIIVTDQALTMLSGTTSAPVKEGWGAMVRINDKDVGLASLDATRQNWSYAMWAQVPGTYSVTVRPLGLLHPNTSYGGWVGTDITQTGITIDAPADAMALAAGQFALFTHEGAVELTGGLAAALPDGAVVQVRSDGAVLGQATVTGLKWSYSLPVQQGRGTHQFSVAILPPGADANDASAEPALAAQATWSFVGQGEGPQSFAIVGITGLADTSGENVVSANGTISDPLPVLRGSIQGALEPVDQIVVFGQAPGGAQTRLGVAQMVNATTWEFRLKTPLPFGGYTLTAMPENRLTGIADDLFGAVANFQVQHIAITTVEDRTGVIRGNVLESAASLTDDATPVIRGQLGAPVRAGLQHLEVSDTVNGVTTVLGRAQLDAADPLRWSFTPSAPLADGRHTLTVAVVETNTAAVQAEHQVSFIKDGSIPAQTVTITQVRDDDGPVIGNVPLNGAIDYPRPLVSGRLSAALTNAQVLRIWQEGAGGAVTYLGDATVTGTNWTWRSDRDMAFGDVRLFATVDNAASVGPVYPAPDGSAHGPRSAVYSFRLLALNDIEVKTPEGNAVEANTVDRLFVISGKLAAPLVNGEYLEVRDGDRILGRASLEDDLGWRFAIDQALSNGQHNFKVSLVGAGNSLTTPLVFGLVPVNVHDAAPDPLQAGLIQAVVALPPTVMLVAGSAFDTLMGQSVRPGQSLGSGRVGIFGTLALAPRAGDIVQVFDNGSLLGTASVAGTRWWYNGPEALGAGDHRFTLRINEQPVPVSNRVTPEVYPIQVLDADAIRIDDLVNRTDTRQSLSGSLVHALGNGEVLGVYRTLNGETVRLGDAQVQDAAREDGRFGWQFTPDAALPLGVGEQTLTLQVEGATHARIAATQSVSILLDESSLATAATILSVSAIQPDGLHSLVPDSRVAASALIVSGDLDRALIGSERVALYDADALVGYATVGANGRSWTYTSTGIGNGHHELKAVVKSDAGIDGPFSPSFGLDVVAYTPAITLTGVREGESSLGNAVALDTQGFSVFAWNMNRAISPDLPNLRATANLAPTGWSQVPQLGFGTYSSAFLPGIPYSTVANYVGSGWFHVDPEQVGLWQFRSPRVDDFEIVSVDGARLMAQRSFGANGLQAGINLDAGWHYLRVDAGNTGGPGSLTISWRRPGESAFSVIRGVQTGPDEKAAALGATDQQHAVTLNYSLSAPLAKDETLQVVDQTAHRVADGLRLQFWNLPADANRTFERALALTETTAPVVSRMTDSVLYDPTHRYDSGVVATSFSMVGRASGWFHVEQGEAGTWLFRGSTRFDHVQLKVDGHTLLSPDTGLDHAQYASLHLDAGWHYLDSTLFQGNNGNLRAEDWQISVQKPGGRDFASLTGFAQFDAAVLGNATVVDAQHGTEFSFDLSIDDGNSHTLSAAVVKAGEAAANPLEDGKSGMTFLANGAFGIIDKQVEVVGDGQHINFSRDHGTINLVNLDADGAAHANGNTLVANARDVQQADIGAAAFLGGSPLLNTSYHQMVVLGGEHDVLKFGDAVSASQWQQDGTIDMAQDRHLTVFTDADRQLQVIVDTHVTLDLEGALRSNAHPVI